MMLAWCEAMLDPRRRAFAVLSDGFIASEHPLIDTDAVITNLAACDVCQSCGWITGPGNTRPAECACTYRSTLASLEELLNVGAYVETGLRALHGDQQCPAES